MFIAYIRYISLLIFSGLIFTFCRATITMLIAGTVNIHTSASLAAKSKPFRLLDELILPLFPVLNTNNPDPAK